MTSPWAISNTGRLLPGLDGFGLITGLGHQFGVQGWRLPDTERLRHRRFPGSARFAGPIRLFEGGSRNDDRGHGMVMLL